MEQLPPKVPSMAPHNWANSFSFQMMPMHQAGNAQQNSWVDDFLDFSASRRSHHRRTVSDPIAFVEEDCQNSNGGLMQACNGNNGFDRLDDEQLRDMFSDETAAGAGGMAEDSPTASDQNSENEEKKVVPESHQVQPKKEPAEEDSSSEPPPPAKSSDNSSGEAIADPKRIKRILANRQSAQRSRVRKLQYISELERSVTTLQTEVSALSPRVAFLDHQRLLLTVDNSALKQRMAALAQDKIFKDAHQEALKKEIERLRQIYHEQNMKKMGNKTTAEAPPPATFNKMDCNAEEE